MSEMGLGFVMGLAVAVVAATLSCVIAIGNIRGDCDTMGATRFGDRVYACIAAKKPTNGS